MIQTTFKYIWHHQCHGILGIFDTIDQMVPEVMQAPYPTPSISKMIDHLQNNNKFEYAFHLISINKVDINFNPEEFEA